MTQKIRPFLWFDGNAEEAVNFYLSVFPDARLGEVSRYGEGMPMPAGTVLVANFTLFGQEFGAINAGPEFKFTEAISFMIDCKDQAEVDYYWDKLTADGGEPSQCGWLKDKYGLSWQVVPKQMVEWFGDPNEKSERAMAALLKMGKLDIAALERAYRG